MVAPIVFEKPFEFEPDYAGFITDVSLRFLGRPQESSSLEHLVNAMKNGTPFEDVVASIQWTEESQRYVYAASVANGSVPDLASQPEPADDSTFVQWVYVRILGRPISEEELMWSLWHFEQTTRANFTAYVSQLEAQWAACISYGPSWGNLPNQWEIYTEDLETHQGMQLQYVARHRYTGYHTVIGSSYNPADWGDATYAGHFSSEDPNYEPPEYRDNWSYGDNGWNFTRDPAFVVLDASGATMRSGYDFIPLGAIDRKSVQGGWREVAFMEITEAELQLPMTEEMKATLTALVEVSTIDDEAAVAAAGVQYTSLADAGYFDGSGTYHKNSGEVVGFLYGAGESYDDPLINMPPYIRYFMGGPPAAGAGSSTASALSVKTYKFGTVAQVAVRAQIQAVDMKNPALNSRELITQLQQNLGFTGSAVSGFLDRNTYRGIRDWRVDFEQKRAQAIAQDLLVNAIRPALALTNLSNQPGMETLLVGTAIHESLRFELRVQMTGGANKALSLFQIEPNSAKFILSVLEKTNLPVYTSISKLGTGNLKSDLENNDKFSASIAAALFAHRLRVNDRPFPPAGDVQSSAQIWKDLYNTPGGAGTPEKFLKDWNMVMGSGK